MCEVKWFFYDKPSHNLSLTLIIILLLLYYYIILFVCQQSFYSINKGFIKNETFLHIFEYTRTGKLGGNWIFI